MSKILERRNYAVDLARALAMVGVISLHVFAAIASGTTDSKLMFSIRIIYTFIYCSVNIFAIISGYLYVGRNVHIKSLLSIYATTLFWCVIMAIIAKVMYNSLGLKELISYLFPYSTDRLWYITCYTFCFAMIPLLNKIIDCLSRVEIKRVLFVLFVILSIVTTITFCDRFHVVSNGYSGLWLCYMYTWGGYFRKYGLPQVKTKKAIVTILMNCMVILILTYILEHFIGDSDKVLTFYMYSSPFIVVNSLLLFSLIIERFKDSSPNKFVYWLSSVSLGVYIIHAHPFILDNVLIYDNFCKIFRSNSWFVWLIGSIVIIGLLYLICGVLDQIRLWLFRLFKVNLLVTRMDNCLTSILRKIEMSLEREV